MILCLRSVTPNVKLKDGRTLNMPNMQQDFLEYSLCDFVSKKTLDFFSCFKLPPGFLAVEPNTWNSNPEYQQCLKFCRMLYVVNDPAERGVKMMQDFNRVSTTDEQQKQMGLQVVEAYRKQYSSYRKSQLM